MVPTLFGRFQTRIVALGVVGGLWTLVVTPLLPSASYGGTFRVLATVLVAGLLWELVYHALQQFRWEKDWPTLLGIVTGVNEGLVAWVLLRRIGLDVPVLVYSVHFSTTWLVVWGFVAGPVRVIAPRWRFRGGRFV